MSVGHVAPGVRVRVFVDFFNFSLSLREDDRDFRCDWGAVGRVLADSAAKQVDAAAIGHYEGMNVYGSYDENSEKDRKLLNWANRTLAALPGIAVVMVPRRKRRKGRICPQCHAEIRQCPECGATQLGTEEKGVDTRIATDMIRMAWDDNYDVAVLASSDRDFVPVVKFLDGRGKKIVHAAFPPRAAELSNACWTRISVPSLRSRFQRTG